MSKVLVAQYHSEIRSLMVLLLRGQGYDVEVARDLAELRQQALQYEPALLVLDVVFPGIDPDNPVELLRSGDMGPSLAETPILLTDVDGVLENNRAAETAGANAVFSPRTGRSKTYLAEVHQLLPPPISPETYVYAWRLDKRELPAFLFACFLFELNGILTLRDKRVNKSLHFVDGWIRSASSSGESDWFGKILLAHNLVTEQALNEVERALQTSKRPIGQEFIARGYLDGGKLQEALYEQYTSIVMSIFEWEQAEITFTDGHPNPEPHLRKHPFRLILDGLEFGFSAMEISKLLPPPLHYLAPTVGTAFRLSDVQLTPEEAKVLQAINGRRRIDAVVSSSPWPEPATRRFLLALLLTRAVVATDQPEEQPVRFSRDFESGAKVLIENSYLEEEQPRGDEAGDEEEKPATDSTPLALEVKARMDARRDTPLFRILAVVLLALLAAIVIFGAYFMCGTHSAPANHSSVTPGQWKVVWAGIASTVVLSLPVTRTRGTRRLDQPSA